MPIALPPPQYDHPYEHRIVVETVPYFQVQAACSKAPPGATRYEGCSWLFVDGDGKEVCHVVYPGLERNEPVVDGADSDEIARFVDLIVHETGHCNGWSNAHPDARYRKTE